jgi:hypothetical protein
VNRTYCTLRCRKKHAVAIRAARDRLTGKDEQGKAVWDKVNQTLVTKELLDAVAQTFLLGGATEPLLFANREKVEWTPPAGISWTFSEADQATGAPPYWMMQKAGELDIMTLIKGGAQVTCLGKDRPKPAV